MSSKCPVEERQAQRVLRFFAVFGGMKASALLEAGTEKLKAQSAKLKKSSKAKAQTRPCRSHAVRRVSFVPWSLFILLSFDQFIFAMSVPFTRALIT